MFPPSADLTEWALDILTGIQYHMGRRTADTPVSRWKDHPVSKLVHLADYCASRKVDAKLQELTDGSL